MTIELLGTVFRLNFSFFAVLTAMLLTCDSRIVTVSIVSSLLHECGHLAFMYAYKEPPDKVIFGGFGIRIERSGVSSLSYARCAAVSIGGVVVNVILATIFFVLYKFFGYTVFSVGLAVNILIGGLNMMPVGILDAGQFLRYILLERFDEDKTEKALEIVSDFTVLIFAFFCVGYTVFVGLNASLICVCLYLLAVKQFRLGSVCTEKLEQKGRLLPNKNHGKQKN
ncbi:MAG: hypothetical protein ACI4SB_03055 [Acutalibacteraceae bacterium]